MSLISTELWVITLTTLAAFLANRQRSWLAPGPLMAGYWAFALALPTIAGYPGTAGAALTIGLLVSAWSAGAIAATSQPAGPPLRPVRVVAGPEEWHRKGLGALVAAGTVSGALAAAYTIRSTGSSVTSALSLSGLFQAGNQAAVERYGGTSTLSPPLVSLLLMVTFTGALVAPYWLLCGRRRFPRRVVSMLPVAGAAADAVATTARTGMVIAAALWAGSYVACRALTGNPVRLRVLTVVRVAACAAAGLLLFGAIAFIRVGGPDARGAWRVPAKTEAYAFGYLPAFSAWQASEEDPSFQFTPQEPQWGALTFNGIAKYAGADAQDNRPYPESVTVDQQGDSTNIYTAWRGLIADFTLPGAMLFMLAAGFLATRSYMVMLARRTPGSLVAVAAISAAVLLSVAYSPFFFTNVCAAVALDAFVMRRLLCRPSPARIRAVAVLSAGVARTPPRTGTLQRR